MPTDDNSRAEPAALGALLGWKRYPSPNGLILRLQASKTLGLAKAGQYDQYDIALNAKQIRALGEFLIHSADEQDGRAPSTSRKRWWFW